MGIMTSTKITVTLAELTDTREILIEKGTNLGEFLRKCDLEYDANVRVTEENKESGEIKSEDYLLQEGDIVTIIGNVSGGIK